MYYIKNVCVCVCVCVCVLHLSHLPMLLLCACVSIDDFYSLFLLDFYFSLRNMKSCSVCQEEFRDENNYKLHLVSKKHIDELSALKKKEKSQVCKKCNLIFRDKTDLFRHFKSSKHNWIKSVEKKDKKKKKFSAQFYCQHCLSSFGLDAMKNHLDEVLSDELDFERYSSGRVMFVYGTASGISEHLASPGFLSTIRKRVLKLLELILSAYPLFKFSLALKAVYRKTFAVVNEKTHNDALGTKELIPFSTSCYDVYRGSKDTKTFITRALNEMIVREDNFVGSGSGWSFVKNLKFFVNIYRSGFIFKHTVD